MPRALLPPKWNVIVYLARKSEEVVTFHYHLLSHNVINWFHYSCAETNLFFSTNIKNQSILNPTCTRQHCTNQIKNLSTFHHEFSLARHTPRVTFVGPWITWLQLLDYQLWNISRHVHLVLITGFQQGCSFSPGDLTTLLWKFTGESSTSLLFDLNVTQRLKNKQWSFYGWQ